MDPWDQVVIRLDAIRNIDPAIFARPIIEPARFPLLVEEI